MAQIRNASAGVSSAIVVLVPALKRLLDVRTRAALSQRDLSKRSGVAQSTIVRLEQGEPNVRPITIRKLAHALNVKPAELMG